MSVPEDMDDAYAWEGPTCGLLNVAIIDGVPIAVADVLIVLLIVITISASLKAARQVKGTTTVLPPSPAAKRVAAVHNATLENLQIGDALGIVLKPEGMMVTGVRPGTLADVQGLQKMANMRLTYVNNTPVSCLADVDKVLDDMSILAGKEGKSGQDISICVPLRFSELDDEEKLEYFAQEKLSLARALSEREEELTDIQKKQASSKEGERLHRQKLAESQEETAKKDVMIGRLEGELQMAGEAIEHKERRLAEMTAELQASSDADSALARALGEASRPPPSQELVVLRGRLEQKEETINDLTRELALLNGQVNDRSRQMSDVQAEDERIQQQMADLRVDHDALSRVADEAAVQHMKETQALREEVASLKQFINAADEENSSLREQAREAEAALSSQTGHANDSQAHMQEEIEVLRTQNGQLSSTKTAAQDEAAALRSRLDTTEAVMEELRTQLDSATTANSEAVATANEKLLMVASLTEELAQKDAELQGAAERLQEVSVRCDEGTEKESELEDVRAQLSSKTLENETSQLRAQALQRDLEEAKVELLSANEKLSNAEQRTERMEDELDALATGREASADEEMKAYVERLSVTQALLQEKDSELVHVQAETADMRETVEHRDNLLEQARKVEAEHQEEIHRLREQLLAKAGSDDEINRLKDENAQLRQAADSFDNAGLEEKFAQISEEADALDAHNQRLTARIEELQAQTPTRGSPGGSSEVGRVKGLLDIEERRSCELSEIISAGERKNDALAESNATLEDMLHSSKARTDMLEKSVDTRETRIQALEQELHTLRAAVSPTRAQSRGYSPRATRITTPPQPQDGLYCSPENDHYGSLEVVSERGASEVPSNGASGLHAQHSGVVKRHASVASASSVDSEKHQTTPTQVEILRMKNGLGANVPRASPRKAATPPRTSPAAASVYARRTATAKSVHPTVDTQYPATLSVTSTEKAVLKGVYELLDTVTHNGYPMWGCASCRIFSSREGYWMVSADDAGPMKNVGRLVSSTTHDGSLPDEVASWDYSNGTEWVTSQQTQITRLNPRSSASPSRHIPRATSLSQSQVSPREQADLRRVSSAVPRLAIPKRDAIPLAGKGWVGGVSGEEGVGGSGGVDVRRSAPSSLKVCRAFAAGHCRQGAACALLHDTAPHQGLVSPSSVSFHNY